MALGYESPALEHSVAGRNTEELKSMCPAILGWSWVLLSRASGKEDGPEPGQG